MTGQEARDDEREAALTAFTERKADGFVFPSASNAFVNGYLAGAESARKHPEPEKHEPEVDEWWALIVNERLRQVSKGYDVDHDREHGVDHLMVWAQDYARRGETLKSAALIEAARELLRKHPEPEITDEAIRQAVLDGLAGASVLQSPFAPQLRALVVEQITLSLRAALRVPVGEGEQ